MNDQELLMTSNGSMNCFHPTCRWWQLKHLISSRLSLLISTSFTNCYVKTTWCYPGSKILFVSLTIHGRFDVQRTFNDWFALLTWLKDVSRRQTPHTVAQFQSQWLTKSLQYLQNLPRFPHTKRDFFFFWKMKIETIHSALSVLL